VGQKDLDGLSILVGSEMLLNANVEKKCTTCAPVIPSLKMHCLRSCLGENSQGPIGLGHNWVLGRLWRCFHRGFNLAELFCEGMLVVQHQT